MEKTVKQILLERGMVESDFSSWASDLYVRVTPISTKFLREEYEFKDTVTTFVDEIEKVPFYDVPFAYAEIYDKKQ